MSQKITRKLKFPTKLVYHIQGDKTAPLGVPKTKFLKKTPLLLTQDRSKYFCILKPTNFVQTISERNICTEFEEVLTKIATC